LADRQDADEAGVVGGEVLGLTEGDDDVVGAAVRVVRVAVGAGVAGADRGRSWAPVVPTGRMNQVPWSGS
jgi:hypothetical protein